MNAAVTKQIACRYIYEVNKWIDNLMYGTLCTNEDLLLQLEADLFLSQIDCNRDFCFNYLLEEPICNLTTNCPITLVNDDDPEKVKCSFIILTFS